MLGLSAAVAGTWVERNGPRKAMFVSAVLLGGRLPGRRARHRHQTALAGLPRLRRPRRHRPRHRLHLAGVDADQVVPRPAGAGDRAGHHGLRRRRADREPAVAAAAVVCTTPATTRRSTSVADGQRTGDAVRDAGHRLLRHHDVRRRPTCGCPPPGWKPGGLRPGHGGREATGHHGRRVGGQRDQDPQFWLLWIVLFCNVTAGIGILEQASPMIQDFFRENGDVHAWRWPRPAGSSACCRCSTWPAGSPGRRPRT